MAPQDPPVVPDTTQSFNGGGNNSADQWITVDTVHAADGSTQQSAGWAGFWDSRTAQYTDKDGVIANKLGNTEYRLSGTAVTGGQVGSPVSQALSAAATIVTSRTDMDKVLDNGKDGLNFFTLLFDRYREATGDYPKGCPAQHPSGDNKCMTDAYDMQRGMKFDHLDAVAQAINVGTLQQALDQQQQATSGLSGNWQGSAGSAAQETLRKVGAVAQDDVHDITQVPALIGKVIDEIGQCVQRKANAFNSLASVTFFNGINMNNGDMTDTAGDDEDRHNDDVSLIIHYSRRRGIGDDTRERIGILFPELPKYIGSITDDSGGKGTTASNTHFDDLAQRLCQQWVHNFIESAGAYAAAFYSLCAQTDTAVKNYLGILSDYLSKIGQQQYPQAQNTGSPNNSSSNSAGSTQTTSSSANPTTTTPTTTTPTTTTPTTTTDPLSSLTQTASQVSQLAQQGISQLSSALGLNGKGTGAKSISANTDSSGQKTLADSDVPGGHVKLTQSPDGTITAAITGTDGKTHQYAVGIKDGKPFFTQLPDAAPASAVASGAGGSSPASGGSGGGGGSAAGGGSGQLAAPSLGSTSQPSQSQPQTAGSAASTGHSGATASTGGMPMGGMPGGGAGAAGKGGGDTDRRSSGIVPRAALWGDLPGRASHVLDAPAMEGVQAEGQPSVAEQPTEASAPSDAVPATPAPAPVTPPAPMQSLAGAGKVEIRIDMGD